MRRLEREKDATLHAIAFTKDCLKHLPNSEVDKRQLEEQLEVLKFDLRQIGHDVSYYRSY